MYNTLFPNSGDPPSIFPTDSLLRKNEQVRLGHFIPVLTPVLPPILVSREVNPVNPDSIQGEGSLKP